jgi:hypothetical protein
VTNIFAEELAAQRKATLRRLQEAEWAADEELVSVLQCRIAELDEIAFRNGLDDRTAAVA